MIVGPHARLRVRELGRARVRLRHRGHRHDHDHDAAVLLRRAPPVAQAAVAGAARRRRLPARRPAVPRREPDQVRARRVAAAADRRRRLHGAHDLAARPRSSSPAARAATRDRCARSSTSCTRAARRCSACRAPRSSSTAASDTTPLAMRANVEHNHVLHEHVVILSIETLPLPHVAEEDRLRIDDLATPTTASATSRRASATWTSRTSRRAARSPSRRAWSAARVDEASYFLSTIELHRRRAGHEPLAQAAVRRDLACHRRRCRVLRPTPRSHGHHGIADRGVGPGWPAGRAAQAVSPSRWVAGPRGRVTDAGAFHPGALLGVRLVPAA